METVEGTEPKPSLRQYPRQLLTDEHIALSVATAAAKKWHWTPHGRNRTPGKKDFDQGGRDKEDGARKTGEVTLLSPASVHGLESWLAFAVGIAWGCRTLAVNGLGPTSPCGSCSGAVGQGMAHVSPTRGGGRGATGGRGLGTGFGHPTLDAGPSPVSRRRLPFLGGGVNPPSDSDCIASSASHSVSFSSADPSSIRLSAVSSLRDPWLLTPFSRALTDSSPAIGESFS